MRNAYTVKLLNKSSIPHTYTLSVSGVDAKMAIIGKDGLPQIEVAPDAPEALRITLTATAPGQGDVEFTARDETGVTVLRAKDRFIER